MYHSTDTELEIASKPFQEKSMNRFGDEIKHDTDVCAVKGSYPAPPDAKHTPVTNSPGSRFESKYAGRNSFMPSSSTDTFTMVQYKITLRYVQKHKSYLQFF